jgi:hypothetical protein
MSVSFTARLHSDEIPPTSSWWIVHASLHTRHSLLPNPTNFQLVDRSRQPCSSKVSSACSPTCACERPAGPLILTGADRAETEHRSRRTLTVEQRSALERKTFSRTPEGSGLTNGSHLGMWALARRSRLQMVKSFVPRNSGLA